MNRTRKRVEVLEFHLRKRKIPASYRSVCSPTNQRGHSVAEINLAVRLSALKMPFRRAIRAAAKLGASSIEIDARQEIHPAQISETGLRQLRKLLEDLNLRVSSLRFQTRRGYDQVEDLDRRVDATKETMKLAYRLGTSVVVNGIGRVPHEQSDPLCSWGT